MKKILVAAVIGATLLGTGTPSLAGSTSPASVAATAVSPRPRCAITAAESTLRSIRPLVSATRSR